MIKRGRKALVNPDDVFNVLQKYKFQIFNNGVQRGLTDSIWDTLHRELEYKIPKKTLYISILQNRHHYQSKLLDLSVDEKNEKTAYKYNESHENFDNDDDNYLAYDNDHDNDFAYDNDHDNDLTYGDDHNITDSGKTTFKLTIPYEEYLKIKPTNILYKDKNGIRAYNILKQNVWSDVINDAFLKVYKLPCNFVYKHGKVNIDMSRSRRFLILNATCKDCKNSLHGWSEKEPSKDSPLVINMLTYDTRGQELEHNSKRQLKGLKRKVVASQMVTDIASNWRRNQDLFEFGRVSPPNLYNNGVLRKAKQDFKEKILGITNKCPINSLVEMKHTIFATSIHSIGIDPLLVTYWTNYQLIIYKDITKSYCKIAIDATGGLIKKIKRTSMNLLSAHIFLYEVVASTSYGQLSICQMISERQDTLTIYTWLLQWLRCGVKIANEVTCDYSTALLGAITRAFCDVNIRCYVSQCFNVLIGKSKKIPSCYVRIDVAHVMKIFCRIPHIKGAQNKYLKNFYVRCFRLLLTSTSLDDFTNILKAILTIILSETDGWVDETIESPAESSRLFLLAKIKDINIEIPNNEDDTFDSTIINIEEEEQNEKESESPLKAIDTYLKEIEQYAINQAKVTGNRVSAYFLPNLAPGILRLCKHFTLWSGVMKNVFQSPNLIASSASVESDFGDLKRRILKFETQPMRVDKFIATHLKALDLNSKLFRSKQIKNDHIHPVKHMPETESDKLNHESKNVNEIKNVHDSDNESSSINSLDVIENWRGYGESNDAKLIKNKKTIGRKRLTAYMDPSPEIERLIEKKTTRSTLNTLLTNGNMSTPLKIAKQKFLIYNTCPFDAVAAIIAMAYTDISTYRIFIDSNENKMLLFCKYLALHGSNQQTYIDRLKIVRPYFKELDNLTNIKIIDTRCNVIFIVEKLLASAPSAIENIRCSSMDCSNTRRQIASPTIILRLKSNGFSDIQEALERYMATKNYNCNDCGGTIVSNRILMQHLFIETDVYSNNKLFCLAEFPVELHINDNNYTFYGAVAYHSDHYIAHIRRAEKKWEIHNDLLKQIKKCSSNINKINPHILVYIKN